MKIEAQSWLNIEEFYKEMPITLKPMLLLVQHIMHLGYDKGLYPYTSMHQLRLSQTSNREWGDCELSIEITDDSEAVLFQYWEHPLLLKPSWSAKYNSSDIKHAFDSVIIKRLRWFKRTG